MLGRCTSRNGRTWLVTGGVIAALGCFSTSASGQVDKEAAPSSPAGMQTGITISERGRVQLHVADMPISTALRLLSVQSQRNIVASPNVKGTVTANLFNVTFEEALDAILTPVGASFRVAGNFIYVYTNSELAVTAGEGHAIVTRIFTLNYVKATDVQPLIAPMLGEGGSIGLSRGNEGAAGGGSAGGAEEASTTIDNVMTVTTRADRMADVERLIKQVDVRPRQVLIEATIVRAELNENNALGIDFTLVGGVDLELLGATSQGGTQVTLGTLPQDRFELFNATAQTGFTSNVPGGGLRLGIIKDHVAVFLQALDEITNTSVIANPKVLATHKQRGKMIVGRRDGYLTTTVTETQAIQTVEFLETGTQLVYRPFIGEDGYIRIELHPKDSVGVVNAQGLPSEQTTEVTTNVIVRDGETILIGGLFREVSTINRSQIPALGSLPGIGPLFRSQGDTTGREEVLILMTVHIVKDSAAYTEASKQTLEGVERVRVGLRKGMMWHGAERLAQWNYARAVELEEQGSRDLALWHLDLSLRNVWNFFPAVELKEKILQRRAWDDDGVPSREFIYRLIAEERGYAIESHERPRLKGKASETAMTEEQVTP